MTVGAGTLVVVATYNERENIGPLLAQVLQNAPGCDVLVVDDSSPDGTSEEVQQIAGGDSRVVLLQRPEKLGLGTAYHAGFQHAMGKDYARVLTMDADFSHHPKHLPAILDRATRPGADLVIGSRYVHGGGVVGWPMPRRVLSSSANAFARRMLSLKPHDCTGAYRCYSRDVVETMERTAVVSHGYSSLLELVWHCQRAGFAIAEVPIVFADRVFGESKVSRSEIYRGLTTVLRLRFRPPTKVSRQIKG
jgi:dolichol-phosphate mannosyltransferase